MAILGSPYLGKLPNTNYDFYKAVSSVVSAHIPCSCDEESLGFKGLRLKSLPLRILGAGLKVSW